MPLIPTFLPINIEVTNPDTGLTEARESSKVVYYQSNNNPYDHCKACKALHKKDSTAIMNFRRGGSAYCEGCSANYKLEQAKNK